MTSRADCEKLDVLVKAMGRAALDGDTRSYVRANHEFHFTIYGAAGSETLLSVIEALWLQVGPFFNRLFTEADLSQRLNDFHENALEAIQRGDAQGARAAIEQDLAYFGQYLLNLLALESGGRRDVR